MTDEGGAWNLEDDRDSLALQHTPDVRRPAAQRLRSTMRSSELRLGVGVGELSVRHPETRAFKRILPSR